MFFCFVVIAFTRAQWRASSTLNRKKKTKSLFSFLIRHDFAYM